MTETLKQTWWAPVAALVVLAQIFMVITFAVGLGDEDGEIAGVVISLVGAVVMAVGLSKRPQARWLGNSLIILGAFLAAFWFWTMFMPVLAIIVLAGVASTEFRSHAPAPRTP